MYIMKESVYYDGTKLLSLSDKNGEKPEIYVSTSNRSAGKTTYFNRLAVNAFLKRGEKFGLIYRFKYELSDIADKFFKDINGLFFPEHEMSSERKAGGIYHDLFIDDMHCGYAFALNSADQIKKYSHLFSDVSRLIFDEFQSETNNYCPDEIRKFISLHMSIARGQNKQVRYVPVYMISNPVTLINPYYVEWNISSRIKADTRYLKGDGFVLEQGFNESASRANKESAFNRAFSQNRYMEYAAQNVYLNDNTAFVEKPDGIGKYLATIKYNNYTFGIREYAEAGIIYCDDHADMSFPFKLTVTTDDHDINYVMLKKNDLFLSSLRYYFDKGCFRFKDLKCKDAILKVLSY